MKRKARVEKHTSDVVGAVAARVLTTGKYTHHDVMRLAASSLAQAVRTTLSPEQLLEYATAVHGIVGKK